MGWVKSSTIVLATIAVVGLCLFLFAIFLQWLQTLGLDLLIGLFVGLTPSMMILYQRKKEREEDYQNWLMQNREACAIELVRMLIESVMNDDIRSEQGKQDALLKRIRRNLPAMMIWASPNLIKQWGEMAKLKEGEDSKSVIRRGERLLRTIRHDLGHDDSDLKPGALWAMLIKPEEKQLSFDACDGEDHSDLAPSGRMT